MEVPPTESIASRPTIRVSTLCLILCGLTVACYMQGVGAPFIFDSLQLQTNQRLQIVQPLWLAMTESTRSFVDWTFALNYQWGGRDPRGYSIVNIAIHVVNALVLFALARGTLSLPSIAPIYRRRATLLAFAIALLWALHPLQTQAVTYVIQRYESLMATFFLLTMLLVLKGSQSQRSYPWYALAILTAWTGMHCKEVMLVAPAILLMYDRVFLATGWKALVRQRGWLHVALFLLAAYVLFDVRAVFDPSAKGAMGVGQDVVTRWEYLRTQPQVILHYLGLAFWPGRLTLDYVWLVADAWWEIYPAGLVVLGLVAASVYAIFRWPPLGFLGLSFFLILAPTSSVIPIVDLAFEHRMYLPLAPLITLLVIAAWWLYCGLPARWKRTPWPAAVGLGIVIALGARTAVRNRDYANPIRIFQQSVEAAPHNARARHSLAILLMAAGQEKEAEVQFKEAIRQQPQYAPPYSAYANLLKKQRRFGEAERRLQQVIELQPDFAPALANYASLLAERGDLEKADEFYRRASESSPGYAVGWLNWGNLDARQGKFGPAITKYQKALAADPRNATAMLNLGLAAFEAKEWKIAAEAFQRLTTLEPDNFDAQLKLAWLQAAAPDAAVRDPHRAIARAQRLMERTNRQNVEIYVVLAAAYANLERFEEAIDVLQKGRAQTHAQQDKPALKRIEESLIDYRARKPYRLD